MHEMPPDSLGGGAEPSRFSAPGVRETCRGIGAERDAIPRNRAKKWALRLAAATQACEPITARGGPVNSKPTLPCAGERPGRVRTSAAREALLYRTVQAHWPRFLADIEADGGEIPAFVRDEFEAYLRCGIMAHRLVHLRCKHCGHGRGVGFFLPADRVWRNSDTPKLAGSRPILGPHRGSWTRWPASR